MATDVLAQRVLAFIRQNGLLQPGETVVVAVSGGPDSVCLLGLLVELQAELALRLHVAHLNHGLRGAAAEDDARYVAELAARLGLAATSGRRDVLAYRKRQRLSLEEAAREVRYIFLADVAAAQGAAAVAAGHTAADQVETLLMHLVRGTGLAGLRGMAPRSVLRLPDGRRLAVVRPLLAIERAATERYCRERNLDPRLDATNEARELLRNRVRQELVPLLERFNPSFGAALLRLAQTAGDELAFVDGQAERAWADLAHAVEGSVVLRAGPLRQLHPALQRHLLRRAVREVRGDLTDLAAVHVEYMRALLARPAGTQIDLPHDMVFAVEYDAYRLSAGEPASPLPPLAGEYGLAVPGTTLLPGWRVRASLLPRSQVQLPTGEPWRACLDFARVGPDLAVRPRRPGDRFQPLGMAGTKRLQDFMVDARIPRRWRDRVPIVATPAQIVWVAGWRIDERARVMPTTETVLCLEFATNDEEWARDGSHV